MKCNNCGRQSQNETANFCDYCGASFREPMQTSMNLAPREQSTPGGMTMAPNHIPFQTNVAKAANQIEKEKTVSFLNWLGTYGIMFIPFVGWLVLIVMLFIWAFDHNTAPSKKNWARATLIFAGIMFILFIFYLIFIISTPMFQDMMQQMSDGTFDYNSYYNSLYQK